MEGTVVDSLRKRFFHMCLLVVHMTSVLICLELTLHKTSVLSVPCDRVLFCLELNTSQKQCVVHSDRVLFCLELNTSQEQRVVHSERVLFCLCRGCLN